ncbi:MAG: SusC/RagA family TonB-linked outer membrane protein [Bacteroidales bacterium]
MKKRRNEGISCHEKVSPNILLTMKLTLVLIMLNVAVVFGGFTQTVLPSSRMGSTTLKEALSEIESHTNYSFLYKADILDPAKLVYLSKDELSRPIEEILNNVLSDAGLQYKIIDNSMIILLPGESNLQQQRKITGSVTDATDGEPLPGANIVVSGTTIGVTTNSDGQYSIEVPEGATSLQFSFVGYIPVTIEIKNQSIINVELNPEIKELNEVIVVGYGTQTKKDISSSVTNISEQNFNKGVARDAVDLLQGKVAGLVITRGSGDVTDENTIRLRGTSSLTGSSEPFVVIDGVPGMSLNSIAPQDIESISILKDASAAAIYGSRSASGVILITTKKGKPGKTEVQYNGYVAIDKVANKPRLLTASEWRNYCAENSIDVTGLDKGGNTDWFDEIMRTGISQNHALSLSGGGEKNSYRASFGYLDRTGVVKDNFLTRYNGRLTFDQKTLQDKLSLKFTVDAVETDYSPSDKHNFVLAYNMIPVYPVKNPDGTWFDSQEYDQGNPVRNIMYNKHLHKDNLLNANIRMDYEIVSNFITSLSLFKQRQMDDYGLYNNSTTQAGRSDLGYARRETSVSDKDLLEFTLNYKKQLEKHNFTILGGYSYEYNHYQFAGAQNRQFVTDIFSYNNLGAGENLKTGDVWSGANMSKLISFFGRINYNFSDKYILTAILRQDGSSKFGKNNKWGTFPSVSAAWRISSEPFMKGIDFISDLKLRASYGVTGNQDGIEPYKSLALYGKSDNKYYDNGQYYTAYQYSQNPNPNLKWEQTAMTNFGIDFDIFKGRLNGSVEYYDKETSNLLYTYDVPVPPYLYGQILANVGSMSNKGFELVLSSDIIRLSNFQWNLTVNFAHNENKITKLSNDEFSTSSIYVGDAFIRGGSYTTTHIVEEGKPVGTFYGWKCLGLDSNGKYIMQQKDPNNLTDEDRTYIGYAQPKFTYGISSMMSYGNFEFNFFLRGVYGNDVLNYSRMSYATTQWLPGANVLKEALTNGLNDNPKYCSYYIEKGSFLRMDNASLAYNLNTRNFWGIQKCKIYLTTQNLFVITNYYGLDPEVDMSGLTPGVEGREYYPKSRIFSLGVTVDF